VGADFREPSFGRVAEAVEDGSCDRELENAVAEELEPLVRRGAVVGPGRVGEDVSEPLGRQLVEQPAELGRPVFEPDATPRAR
jgi:hypothetical protein